MKTKILLFITFLIISACSKEVIKSSEKKLLTFKTDVANEISNAIDEATHTVSIMLPAKSNLTEAEVVENRSSILGVSNALCLRVREKGHFEET